MGYDRRAPQLGKSFFFDHLWSTSIGAQILSLTIIRKTTTQNHYAVLGLNLHHSNSNNTVSVCFQLHLYWQSLKAVVLHHWALKKQLGQLRFLKGGSQLHPSTISTIGSQPVQSISISKKVTTLTFQLETHSATVTSDGEAISDNFWKDVEKNHPNFSVIRDIQHHHTIPRKW